jgi:hypothetical protein
MRISTMALGAALVSALAGFASPASAHGPEWHPAPWHWKHRPHFHHPSWHHWKKRFGPPRRVEHHHHYYAAPAAAAQPGLHVIFPDIYVPWPQPR